MDLKFSPEAIESWIDIVYNKPGFDQHDWNRNLTEAEFLLRSGVLTGRLETPPRRINNIPLVGPTPAEIYIKEKLETPVGVKFDTGKPSPSLLPMKPLLEVVKVLDFGAKKYARDNWQKVSNAEERYLDAALRHLMAFTDGEENDEESGLSHLAHCMCCLLFLLWFRLKNK